jgi:hypothetical protein
MGGSTKTSNQNQFQVQNQATTSAPWSIAQPGLQQSLDLATRAAGTTYNGSSVAPLDPLVSQGQNANLAAAAANQPGQMANSFVNAYQPLLANGGVSALGLSGVGNLDAAASYLNPYASGQYVQSAVSFHRQAGLVRLPKLGLLLELFRLLTMRLGWVSTTRTFRTSSRLFRAWGISVKPRQGSASRGLEISTPTSVPCRPWLKAISGRGIRFRALVDKIWTMLSGSLMRPIRTHGRRLRTLLRSQVALAS